MVVGNEASREVTEPKREYLPCVSSPLPLPCLCPPSRAPVCPMPRRRRASRCGGRPTGRTSSTRIRSTPAIGTTPCGRIAREDTTGTKVGAMRRPSTWVRRTTGRRECGEIRTAPADWTPTSSAARSTLG